MSVGFLPRASAEGGAAPVPEVYAFGPFVLDVARHVLTRGGRPDGQPIALAPKTFESLIILVRSGGACCRGRDV